MLHEWYLAISIICLLVIAEGVHRLTRQLGYLTAVAEHTSSMAKALWRIREELEWMRNGKTDEKMYSEAQAILSEVEENEKKC